MNAHELKKFIKEQCGDPALGICDVGDLSDSQVDALKKTNTIMAKYSPIFDPGTPVLHPGNSWTTQEQHLSSEAILTLEDRSFPALLHGEKL